MRPLFNGPISLELLHVVLVPQSEVNFWEFSYIFYDHEPSQWRNYICGAQRQDIERRPCPFPFFPFRSLPHPLFYFPLSLPFLPPLRSRSP